MKRQMGDLLLGNEIAHQSGSHSSNYVGVEKLSYSPTVVGVIKRVRLA